MNQIKHSLADWDFRSPTNWVITTAYYVSSPSSLKLGTVDGWLIGWGYLKTPLGACITNGRFVIQRRPAQGLDQDIDVCYRVQAKPTNRLPADCYYWNIQNTNCALRRRVAGVNTGLGGGAYPNPFPSTGWCRFRITWYEYISATLQKTLRHILDIEVSGAWVQQFLVDDTVNKWFDSLTNRIGFSTNAGGTYNPHLCLDNTEIWKAIT